MITVIIMITMIIVTTTYIHIYMYTKNPLFHHGFGLPTCWWQAVMRQQGSHHLHRDPEPGWAPWAPWMSKLEREDFPGSRRFRTYPLDPSGNLT